MTNAASPPGLIVAAPRSGGGKTTVTLGLLAAFRAAGVVVQPFKCGPDYIDPAFHGAAAGRASYNLDSWAMRRETVTGLIAGQAVGAELVIAEGVMGLFDGVSTPGAFGTGATADIAKLTGWPVVLVLDVSGQAQTAAAVVAGCVQLLEGSRIAGVILNRVGSERHRRLVQPAIEALGVPVLGALPRNEAIVLPERHLGLVQAEETAKLAERLQSLGDFIREHIDIATLRDVARTPARHTNPRHPGEGRDLRQIAAIGLLASPVQLPLVVGPGLRRDDGVGIPPPGRKIALARDAALWAWHRTSCGRPGRKIALARDAAFSFIYPHLLLAWQAAGADILPFSPLADEPPAAEADAIWLPGGYPELHASRLAAATRFKDGLADAVRRDVPVHGECGGFMVLGEGLIDAAGERHAMAGLIPLVTSFADRKLHLGYRLATLAIAGPLGTSGQVIRGHEFHYAATMSLSGAPFAHITDAEGNPTPERGARLRSASGSFFHFVDIASDNS